MQFEVHNIPLEVKNDINRMAKKQGLHVQVVRLRRKDLKFIASKKRIKMKQVPRSICKITEFV